MQEDNLLHDDQTIGGDKSDLSRDDKPGLTIEPWFCPQDRDPYRLAADLDHPGDPAYATAIEWSSDRLAKITNPDGKVIFEQKNVAFPKHFSDTAVNIVASKYFYGPQFADPLLSPAEGGREDSLAWLVDRVVNTITDWGRKGGYFATAQDAVTYNRELKALVVGQYGAFNSPVWFNLGVDSYGIKANTDAWRWDKATNQAVRVADGESYKYPQCSACFILSVADNMQSIGDRARAEMTLFKSGSGCGTDNSTLRSKRERLSGGGRPSGPLSFMRVYDAVAAVTKSGGVTRRAAKMEILRYDHPDILEFIEAKPHEEKKAHALIDAGYDGNFNGEAYGTVLFQNSNLSVRVSDEFMAQAAGDDPDPLYATIAVTTGTHVNTAGKVMPSYNARDILDKIAEGTWQCGDPGLQFDDTINDWHTLPNTGRIRASNPCSEYLHLDDSACNLASLNLLKFRRKDGTFNVKAFRQAVRIFIIAQEILVDNAGYPTQKIAENSHKSRPLGLGYCNLGALLMSMGIPYDSHEGRQLAGVITAIMHGQANLTSADIARVLGPFEYFAANRDAMLRVMDMHEAALDDIDSQDGATNRLHEDARMIWGYVHEYGRRYGFRNSQVTALAPTGTIAFMMDADTTGVEPDIALVKYKTLAGGGQLKIVNQTIPMALEALGYPEATVKQIVAHVEAHDTIECLGILGEDLPVFDCAFPPPQGGRSIHYTGHLKMMAAIQPFISGALSKTVNMPNSSSIQDIRNAYIEAWRLGLKCVAIYRDGSKRSQPLSTKKEEPTVTVNREHEDDDIDMTTPDDRLILSALRDKAVAMSKIQQAEDEALLNDVGVQAANNVIQRASDAEKENKELKARLAELEGRLQGCEGPYRRKLPKTRPAVTHHFSVGGHEGYLTIGFYPDTGEPGEIFITMAKEGSTIGGLMDVIATQASMGLQYGVPLEASVRKFAHTRFSPDGFTGNADVPIASSLADYIFRWLGMQYVPGYREEQRKVTPGLPEASERATDPKAVPGMEARPVVSEAFLAAVNIEEAASISPITGGAPVTTAAVNKYQWDAPLCDTCGSITVRAGSCYSCRVCGATTGCG